MARRAQHDKSLHRAWENGCCESFNGKLRDECFNGEIFCSLKEAQMVVQYWRFHYHTRRPRSSLEYKPPAPLAIMPSVPPLDAMSNMQ